MRIVSISLMVLGVLGLSVTFLGEITALGDYKSSPPRSWEKFDPQLVLETPSLVSLQNKIDSLTNQPTNQPITEQEKMLIIYEFVINRFTHGDQAKYNIFSNWLLYLTGRVHPAFSHIRHPSIVVEKGYSAFCGEQAYLLQTLAERKSIRTRSVGLNGHVVMEAWFDNEWHMYDPDLEVIPILTNKQVLSLDELARSPELIHKYYTGRGREEYIQLIVGIISSREDNSFTSYPRLALFEWKTNVLFYVEKIANVMKWILPMILLVMGFGLFFKNRKNSCAVL